MPESPSPYSARVERLSSRWLFAWGFLVYDAEGKFVYGEKNIESRRAAQKDADDLVARLSDGRIWIHPEAGLIYA